MSRAALAPLAAAAAVVVAGCAASPPPERVLDRWIGAQEAELVDRWGAPTQAYDQGGRRFLVFESRTRLQLPGTMGVSDGGASVAGSPGLDVALTCIVTFELEAAKVATASYRGEGCSSARLARVRR